MPHLEPGPNSGSCGARGVRPAPETTARLSARAAGWSGGRPGPLWSNPLPLDSGPVHCHSRWRVVALLARRGRTNNVDTLEKYEKRLKGALEERTPYFEFNRDLFHAKVVIVTAFEHASREILILSHKLDWMVYGAQDFLAALKTFLDRDGGPRLVIVVETGIGRDHPLLRQIRHEGMAEHRSRIEILELTNSELKYPFNFMIVDDIGFRLEPDRSKPRAIVAFHGDEKDREALAGLKKMFQILKSKSTPVSVD